MSTEILKKKYELKARAESQRETRNRIAQAASQLHEEKGVAATSIAEIARRAGVSRLTVYNHFPDLASLLPACAAHFESQHPFPDLSEALRGVSPHRVGAVLAALYPWYRETAPLWSKVFSDRAGLPELDAFLREGIDTNLDALAADLAGSLETTAEADAKRLAMMRLALDFWTWRRLTNDGLEDLVAAQMMADVATSI